MGTASVDTAAVGLGLARRLLAGGALAASMLSGCAHTARPGQGPDAAATAPEECRAGPPGRGELLPPLPVMDFPGGTARELAAGRGRVVLLDVWATWCEPCRDTLPIYASLLRELGPRGLEVYALSVDEDVQQVSEFLAETGLALPVLVDAGARSAECRLALRGVPTLFLLDRQGRVRWVHEGASEAGLAAIRREVEALLAEPAAAQGDLGSGGGAP